METESFLNTLLQYSKLQCKFSRQRSKIIETHFRWQAPGGCIAYSVNRWVAVQCQHAREKQMLGTDRSMRHKQF